MLDLLVILLMRIIVTIDAKQPMIENIKVTKTNARSLSELPLNLDILLDKSSQ